MTEPPRCGVCGVAHPHLDVCPFVAETEVSIDAKSGRRVVRTRYFERPQLFDALVEASTDEDEI